MVVTHGEAVVAATRMTDDLEARESRTRFPRRALWSSTVFVDDDDDKDGEKKKTAMAARRRRARSALAAARRRRLRPVGALRGGPRRRVRVVVEDKW